MFDKKGCDFGVVPSVADASPSGGTWAPLIYTRTRLVDFRFLALPEGIRPSEQELLLSLVRLGFKSVTEVWVDASTGEVVPTNVIPVWTCFKCKDPLISVIGISCWASALTNESEFTRDKVNRGIYGFYGAMCRGISSSGPPMDVNEFRPLYERVRTQFEEDCDQPFRSKSQYDWNWSLSCDAGVSVFDFNRTCRDNVKLWPGADAERLWCAAVTGDSPVSLCVNLSEEKGVLTSPVLNGSVLGRQEVQLVSRAQPMTVVEAMHSSTGVSQNAQIVKLHRRASKRGKPPLKDRSDSSRGVFQRGFDAIGFFVSAAFGGGNVDARGVSDEDVLEPIRLKEVDPAKKTATKPATKPSGFEAFERTSEGSVDVAPPAPSEFERNDGLQGDGVNAQG